MNISKIRELDFEKILNIIFIVASAINIYGSNLQQQFLIFNRGEDEKKARTLFIIAVILSIIVYAYLIKRNYRNYLEDDNKLEQIRLYGSILLIIGALMILYYLLNSPLEFGSPAI